MGANPSKRERWPIEPGTRHVWVMGQYRHNVPVQGYIVDRKKLSARRWVALVVTMEKADDEWVQIHRWVSMSKLRPVFSTPEDGPREEPYRVAMRDVLRAGQIALVSARSLLALR